MRSDITIELFSIDDRQRGPARSIQIGQKLEGCKAQED